jgi:hypothetical protein
VEGKNIPDMIECSLDVNDSIQTVSLLCYRPCGAITYNQLVLINARSPGRALVE